MQEAEIIKASIDDFRRRHPDELARGPIVPTPIGWFTAERAEQMFAAHREMVAAAWHSDREQHGRADFWDVDRDGDCEDKALWAHRRLAAEGWPKSAMRIWLCLAPLGGKWRGHAVLGIKLTLSDGSSVLTVLDQLRARPMRLEDLGYRFWRMVD